MKNRYNEKHKKKKNVKKRKYNAKQKRKQKNRENNVKKRKYNAKQKIYFETKITKCKEGRREEER